MKQIFRFASVFALAGAALLYTGCAKDYNEEIASVKQELKNLQDGVIADHTSQIKALQGQVTTLQGVDQELRNSISALDAAYKKADAELSSAISANAAEITKLKSDLQTAKTELSAAIAANTKDIAVLSAKVTEMEKTLSNKIKANEDNIAKLQDKISTIQVAMATLEAKVTANAAAIEKCNKAISENRTWAEQTLATKSALETVSQNLGALSATVEALDKKLTAADVQLASGISGVKATAEKAAQDVATALGQITELWNNFNNYYKKGEVDGMISDINTQIALLKAKDEEIVNKLAEEVARLDEADAANTKAINDEIKNREEEVKALAQKLAEEVAKLKGVDDENLKLITANAEAIAAEAAKREGDVKTLNELLTSEVKTLNEAIKANEGKISENAADIVANANKIADEIKNRQAAIDALREELVEKINAVGKELGLEVDARINEDKAIRGELATVKSDLETLINNEFGKAVEQAKGYTDQAVVAAVNGLKQNEIKELQDKANSLQEQIDAITGEGKTLDQIKERISTLEDQVNTLNANVKDLAGRVTSISVCPSKEDEVITIKVGDKNVRMFKATFEVEPVAAAAAFTKENIVLTYAEARPRTKGALTEGVSYKEAVIDSVYADAAGRVTVIAKNIDPLESNNNARFFALTYNGVDKASKYSVTSDYAQALESDSAYDLIAYFKYSVRGVVSIAKTLIVPTRVDYVTAAKDETVYEPFKDFAIVYNCEKLKNFIPEQLTPEKFTEWTGLELTFVPEYSIDYPLIDVDLKELNSKDRFDNTVDLSQYVRFDSYYFLLQYTINNEKWNRDLKHQVTLTKVQHNIVDLDNLYLYWNYKTYKDADRIASKKVSEMAESIKNVWDEAANHGAKAVKQLGFNGKAGVVFDFGVWDQTENDYLDEIKATGKALPDTAFTGNYAYKDTINKTCTSDDYFFAVKVSGDAKMADQVLVVNADVAGSVTKQVDVPVENVFSSILKDEKGNVKSALISGLTGDDAKYENVYKAALRCIVSKHFNITVDGESIGDSYTFKPETDSLYIHVPAGKMRYDEKHTVVATADDIFGFKYTITVNVTTEAAPFKLATRAWIKDGVGTARGAIVGGLYTLNDMFYAKQVELVNLDGSQFDETKYNEEIGTDYKVVFSINKPTPEYNGDVTNTIGAAGMSFTKVGLLADETSTMEWGTFTGLKFNVSAQLEVDGVKVNVPVVYAIETQKPVEFRSLENITKQRTPKVDLPIKLYESAVVYGVVDGKIVEQNVVKPDGTISKYADTYFVYGKPETWKVTLNGQELTPDKFVENYDYKFDADKGILTILGDNLKGELKIKMSVTLNYYLDCQTGSGADLKHTAAETKEYEIIVNQN